MLEKRCSRCGETQPLANFYPHNSTLDRRAPHCRDCERTRCKERYNDPERAAARLAKREAKRLARVARGAPKAPKRVFNFAGRVKSMYGVTFEEVRRALSDNLGLCANVACGKEITFDVRGHEHNRAMIDHDHATGKFRGVLCRECNTSLGYFEKDKNYILGLTKYLSEHS